MHQNAQIPLWYSYVPVRVTRASTLNGQGLDIQKSLHFDRRLVGKNAEAPTSHGHEHRRTVHQNAQMFLQKMYVPMRAMCFSALNGTDAHMQSSLHFDRSLVLKCMMGDRRCFRDSRRFI